MKVDSTTWVSENNQAGKYLADALEKSIDEKLPQKVSSYFQKFNTRANALNGMEKGMRHFYLLLLLEKTRKDIRKNFTEKKIASLMENVLVSMYRNEVINFIRNETTGRSISR